MENQPQKTPKKRTYQEVLEMPDSEKLSDILWELKKQSKISDRILNNILFFFWVIVISGILTILSIALAGTGPIA